MQRPQPDEQRIRAVMAWLKQNPQRLDMRHYISDCGTTGCLAGWTYLLATGKTKIENVDVEDFAGDWLGLDDAQQTEIFYYLRTCGDWHMCDDRRHDVAYSDLERRVQQVTGVRFDQQAHAHAGAS